MTSLLSKKQICMEGGCMLGSIVFSIGLIALCIGVVYAVYMYQWGVWNERNDG